MDMMSIGSAILLIAMIVMVAPRVKHAVQNSPKGSSNDWLLAGGLIFAVAVFVYALMKMV
jgi:predicted membrane channel-forming protein YqfA (hemolysin III family)